MPKPPPASSLKQALEALIESSGAMTVLLITKEGTSLAEAGDTRSLNTTAMAALVAGMFSATREVARMVGEHQFSILLQQGESRHIHISLVSDSAMMVIIFEDYQRIGRVRHEARKVAETMGVLLAARGGREAASKEIGIPQFREYALNLIDSIFVTKDK